MMSWCKANRSVSRRSPIARPRLEALEDRCLPSVTINEFPLGGQASNIQAGPDGNVWFSAPHQSLGRITPAGQITGSTFASLPEEIQSFRFGRDGNIWVGGSTYISEETPQGVLLHAYQIPSALNVQYSSLYVTLGPDGNIWYSNYGGNGIGKLTPDGQITEFPIPFPAYEMITGPDGNLWFEGTSTHAIGRVTPTGSVTIFNNPDNGQTTGAFRGITSGPNGNLWMDQPSSPVIEEVNTAGQLVATYSVPGGAYEMTVGSDGNLWFAVQDNNHIGSITPQGIVTEYQVPTLNSVPVGITAGPDGNIWFTEGAAGQIGEVVLSPSIPAVGAISAPLAPVAINTIVNASASFTDTIPSNTHTALWNWGDGSTSNGTVSESNGAGTVTGSHAYSVDGVYTVTLKVTNNQGGSGQSVFNYVVVYNPSAGFVTGGGWFNSPAGADAANPTLTGKANFGFNAKYKSGSTVPTGDTEFQFPAGSLDFHSTSYDWLVITGSQAQYQGSGTINGAGNYGFLVTALDNGGGSTPDKLRIKIWDQNNNNAVVYDTQPGAATTAAPTTPLGGGRIQVHSTSTPNEANSGNVPQLTSSSPQGAVLSNAGSGVMQETPVTGVGPQAAGQSAPPAAPLDYALAAEGQQALLDETLWAALGYHRRNDILDPLS